MKRSQIRTTVTTKVVTVFRSLYGKQEFCGKLKAFFYHNPANGKLEKQTGALSGKIVFQTGDLLVFEEERGRLRLYRYTDHRYADPRTGFVMLKKNAVDYVYCPYGFVYRNYRDEWRFQSDSLNVFLGKERVVPGLYCEKTQDGVLLMSRLNKDRVEQFYWESYEKRCFIGHQGEFVIGKLPNGSYEVLTPVGRWYQPRRHCYLKSADNPDDVILLGWNGGRQFVCLYRGKDETLWMNSVGFVRDDGRFVLYGFKENIRQKLGEGRDYFIDDCQPEKSFVQVGSVMFDSMGGGFVLSDEPKDVAAD